MLSCIILSAGLSHRFGSPKALAKINIETVVEHLQRLLLATQIQEIVIVLGHDAKKIEPHLLKHKRIRFVYNKDYNLGQTSSFKVGLEAANPQAQGIMLLPVDYPVIKKETIDRLIELFLDKKPAILIPTFENQKGHPPIFHAKLKPEILSLPNDVGLNTVAYKHQKDTMVLALKDGGIVKSFNTPAEFEQLKKQLIG